MQESLPDAPYCAKREFVARITLPNGMVLSSFNICLALFWEPNWKCPRIDRSKENGKDWKACHNTHGEINGILSLLWHLGIINTRGQYLDYMEKFARGAFQELPLESAPRINIDEEFTYLTEEGEALMRELFELVTPEAAELLKGATIDLGNMDWICYICGLVLKHFGIHTNLRIAETPWDEPSTSSVQ